MITKIVKIPVGSGSKGLDRLCSAARHVSNGRKVILVGPSAILEAYPDKSVTSVPTSVVLRKQLFKNWDEGHLILLYEVAQTVWPSGRPMTIAAALASKAEVWITTQVDTGDWQSLSAYQKKMLSIHLTGSDGLTELTLLPAGAVESTAPDDRHKPKETPRKSRLYGCWNGTRAATYIARDGYDVSEDWSATCATGPVRFVNIEDSMSKDCKYDLADTDAKCIGCKKSPLLPDYVSQGELK